MQRALLFALVAFAFAAAPVSVVAQNAPAWAHVKHALVVVGYRKSGCTFTTDRGNCAFKSYGTAFCIQSDANTSEFLTDAHVVSPAPDGYTLVVLLPGFRAEVPATIVQQNGDADLAEISAPIGNLPKLHVSSQMPSETADVAVAGFGYAEGVIFAGLLGGATLGHGDLIPAWHPGVVSAVHEQFIDFNLPGSKASEGLSGAPLFDPKTGEVYGVQDIYPTTGSAQVAEAGDDLATSRDVLIAFLNNQNPSTGIANMGNTLQKTSASNDSSQAVAANNDPVTLYRTAADKGDAGAQNALGLIYLDGTNGVPQDTAQAMHYFQLAAAQGDAKAQANLGYMYHFGLGVTQNYATAARYYNLAVGQGDDTAQNNLGTLYYYGQGVARDLNQAASYYKLAAAQGNAYAQSNLGYMYEFGEVVPQDYAIARHYFELSAAQGNPRGQTNLGYLYHTALGVSKNIDLALKYYELAAAQGDAAGQRNLGTLYEYGEGVTQSYNTAAQYYQLSAAQGDARGEYLLGHLYDLGRGVPKDFAAALKYYQLAAAQNDMEADYALGYLYDVGTGVTQSDAQALHYYELAAAQGEDTAQNNLGAMYARGQGVPQNYATARHYYELAAAQGNATAEFNLGTIYEKGYGVPVNYALALKYYKLAAAQKAEGAADAVTRVSKIIQER